MEKEVSYDSPGTTKSKSCRDDGDQAAERPKEFQSADLFVMETKDVSRAQEFLSRIPGGNEEKSKTCENNQEER
jgi:hypothetical protein